MAIIGKVIAMTGVANIINDKGDKSALTPGAQIQTGDSIQTAAGVTVDVQLANGRVIHIGTDQLVNFTPELAEVFAPTQAENAVDVATIDSVINALENGENVNEVLAANGNPNDPAGGTQEGHGTVFLQRINELLNPLAFPQASIASNALEIESVQIIQPNIGAITPDTENEGTSLVHTITINNALGVTMTFPFSIVGITASPDDIGAPIFSDGVTLNAAGDTITVPGGVTSFTVTVPSLADNLIEGNETYQINIGTLSAIGTIVDTTQGPTIISVEPGDSGVGDDAVPEGTNLIYTVTLSGAPTVATSYEFVLGGGTASAGDFGEPSFSDGVTLLNGVITVPAGVTSFTVTVPTIVDGIVEGTVNETLPLTIGGVTGVGQIIDPVESETPTIISVEPGDSGIGDDAVPEGTNLIYTVTLSGATTVATSYEFVLGGGTASAGDFGEPTFSDGVTLLNGVITVPAGVTSFTVTVPTVQDLLVEDGLNETVPLTVGGVEGIGQIIDDDLIVTSVNPGSGDLDPFSGVRAVGSAVVEGDASDPLHFTVTLSKAAVAPTEVTLSFTNGTGTFGTDTTTPLQVSFDDGATFTPLTGTTVTVPVGVSSFIVSVPTTPDTLVEADETILFTASTASNTVADTPAPVAGTIIDNDGIFVTRVDAGSGDLDPFSGVRAVGSAVTEGDTANPLHYTVTLNQAAVVPTVVTLAFSSGTGTFGTDTTTPLQVSFDNGVTFTSLTGTTVTVPVGVSSFIVSVPTFDDTIVETDETILFTASTASNGVDGNPDAPTSVAGTIIDDDLIVTRVDAGSGDLDPFSGVRAVGSAVVEGDASDPLHFTVTLSKAAVAPTEVTLSFTNGTGTFGTDTTTPLQVSFDDGLTFTPLTGTTVTVPVGVSSFIVSVPTFDDTIVEADETILFTASTASNTAADTPAPVAGTIIDNDGIFVTRVDAGSGDLDPFSGVRAVGSAVTEGDTANPLHYTVTLNQAAVVPTVVTLALSSGTGTFGTDTTTPLQVSFDNGVTFTSLTGTTVTVPAGVSSFIVSVPTFDDTIVETDETILFTASTASNGVDGNPDAPISVAGTIIDNDVLPLATGLSGEYFGYNDGAAFNTELFTPSNLRHHQDDQLTSTEDLQNLDSIADVEAVINGRNGTILVGTADKTNTGTADATFNATEISYGLRSGASIDSFSALDLTVTNNLGSNVVQSAGETLDSTSALSIFLDKDGTTATVQTGAELATSPTGTGTSSGIGLTTDSIIRLTGSVFLPRGNYDFRVLADDGFRLKVGGETLIEFDGNQSPTVREYLNLSIDGTLSGLTPIELIYWEQGQNGVLRIEYKLSSETTYKTFSLDNLAMFSDSVDLNLAENQDLVNTGTDGNPNWVVRTGLEVNSTSDAGETLTGSAAKDVIVGGVGDDTLNGLAGNDTLRGNSGNDTINGGDGSDVLDGGLGDDIMTGGLGDDIYYVDSVGDITFEAAGEGTDTIELDALYGELNYTIGDNIENLNLNGSQAQNVIGNDLANRIIGNSGNNQIDGGAGNDRIIGGQGSDELTGGVGSDVFEWNLSDIDGIGIPEDHITDFVFTGNGEIDPNPNNPGAVTRTDAIDLRDLLQGESSTLGDANFPDLINPGNLLSYLNFEVDGTGSTVISVSSNGGFAGGFDAGAVDQRIVLDNVNLFTATASGGDSTLLLKNLLANGSLIVD